MISIRQLGIMLILVCLVSRSAAQRDSFLFRTPLSFYNTDILAYLQVLHKNQQYDQMVPFFTGPYVSEKSAEDIATMLSDAPFGYVMKRSGLREIERNQSWSLTYSRTILGTQETFKIDCVLERDTCRVVLNRNSMNSIFKQ
jgi:hypothetical protein